MGVKKRRDSCTWCPCVQTDSMSDDVISPYSAAAWKKRPRSATLGVDTSYGDLPDDVKERARQLCRSVNFALRERFDTDGSRFASAKRPIKPQVVEFLRANPSLWTIAKLGSINSDTRNGARKRQKRKNGVDSDGSSHD